MHKHLRAFTILILTTQLLSAAVLPIAYANAQSSTCQNPDPDTCLHNPIGPNSELASDFVVTLLKFIMGTIAFLSIVVIVFSGFRLVASGGNEEEAKKAKRMLTWAVIGFALTALAYSIVAITQNAVTGK